MNPGYLSVHAPARVGQGEGDRNSKRDLNEAMNSDHTWGLSACLGVGRLKNTLYGFIQQGIELSIGLLS